MTQSTSIPEFMSGMIQQPALVETTEVEIKEGVTVEGLSSLLVALSSSLANLYLQSHLIHLNVEGPLFLPVHEFLKDQYEAHVGQLDKTGELTRTLDVFMPMCAKGLLGACKTFKHVKTYECREMLMTYLKNLENIGMEAKDVGEYAKELKAPDVENYMAELVGEMFKAAWFIKSTLRG
jgi:DNA-binding ferritin-like protein